MARMVITGIPHPPESETWCAVCLSLAKGEAFTDPKVQDRIKQGLADEKAAVFTVPVDTKEFLRAIELAISWGGHPLIAQGALVVPLCGTHFPAVDPTAPPPPAPPKPGLYRGGGLN